MSIVSCASCGMQFNAAGYQPGVQFQCTQCGSMVTVAGGGAPAGRPGAKRATGVQKRGPAAGPRAARGGPPGPQQQDAGYQQAYAPKKSNTGMFVGIGVGVVVIGIIIAVVVMASGPSPQQQQKSAADKSQEDAKAAIAKADAETKAKNDALKATLNAALERGSAIESALRSGDKAALEGMFDWTNYAAYLSDLASKDTKFLGSGPLFSTGDWEKTADGKMSGKWLGQAVHGPESLKTAVMGYIEEFLFGSPEIKFDKPRTETLDGGFSGLKINGKEYLGKKVFIDIKGAGKMKEFWVGATMGDDQVKIINFRDGSALTALQQKAGKANRAAGSDDDRSHMRDDRDTTRPDDPKEEPGPGEEGPIEDGPVEEDLPAVGKTSAMPKEAALINILNQLKDGNKLKPAQKNSMTSAKAEDRKAMMGALIDALIDAHNAGKRREKAMISDAMMQVWGNFARNEGFSNDDVVYEVEGRTQNDTDDPIRRWIKVYNGYNPK